MFTVESQNLEIANPVTHDPDVQGISRLRDDRIHLGRISTVQLPSTIFWAILLFALLLFVVVGLVLGSRNLSTQPIYPLAPFEGIQPGHPETVLAAYDCSPTTAANYGEDQSCEITPDDPLIQRIQVSTGHGMIKSALFTLNGLPLGYLKLRWGNPEFVQVRERFFVARWQSGLYARGRISGDFSYTAPVYLLSFVEA